MPAGETPVLEVVREGPVCRVTLNRPALHNAFDDALIAQLLATFDGLAVADDVRVIVLAGAGSSFCAGGDLNWMGRMAGFDRARNLEDARALAAMFEAIDTCPKPVIARVHGLALGGGCGLVACSDIVVASESARFAFSEVRLGLVPATISPFVHAKIGSAAARRYFLTGERFDAREAHRIGLVSAVTSAEGLDGEVERIVAELRACGPRAVARSKSLVRELVLRRLPEANEFTARLIAEVRASDEGREGIAAFLQKRPPSWADPKG